MTPQPQLPVAEIAKQAAEAVESCIQTSFGEFEDFDRVEAAKIILTAAAKMVRQSGAVEALREDIISARIIHSEAEHNGKWAIQRDCAFIEERCYKALDRLRSITGEAGK